MALARTCRKKQVRLILCGVDHQPLEMMQRCGLLAQLPEHDLRPDLGQGLAAVLGR
jgi:SulP family sulfate permease